MSEFSQEDFLAAAQFANEEPKRFDMVPEIIDHLTYIEVEEDKETGELRYYRKRLSPIDKELYRVLRQRAGSGLCWRGQQSLADQVGCSHTTIVQSKRVLAGSFEQLGGRSLISIDERLCPVKREDRVISKCTRHFITVENIWFYNNSYMEALKGREFEYPKRKELLKPEEGELAIERMAQKNPINDVHKSVRNQGALSKNGQGVDALSKNGQPGSRDPIQNWTVNKDTLNRAMCSETYPPPEAEECGALDSDLCSCFRTQELSFEWLSAMGVSARVAQTLASLPAHELVSIAKYVLAMETRALNAGKTFNSGAYIVATYQYGWHLT